MTRMDLAFSAASASCFISTIRMIPSGARCIGDTGLLKICWTGSRSRWLWRRIARMTRLAASRVPRSRKMADTGSCTPALSMSRPQAERRSTSAWRGPMTVSMLKRRRKTRLCPGFHSCAGYPRFSPGSRPSGPFLTNCPFSHMMNQNRHL